MFPFDRTYWSNFLKILVHKVNIKYIAKRKKGSQSILTFLKYHPEASHSRLVLFLPKFLYFSRLNRFYPCFFFQLFLLFYFSVILHGQLLINVGWFILLPAFYWLLFNKRICVSAGGTWQYPHLMANNKLAKVWINPRLYTNDRKVSQKNKIVKKLKKQR